MAPQEIPNGNPSIHISHVIFDFDGILVDTERLYTEANERTLGKFGGKFTIELKSMMMGKKKRDAVRTLVEASGLGGEVTVEEYTEEYDNNIDLMMRQTEALPGADKLIRHLFTNNVPLAICTGSDQIEFQQKTTKFKDWLKMVPEQARLLCGSDPEIEGKPSPEPYQKLIGRLPAIYPHLAEPNPENVLVFEDSINGVKSAVAAGCTVIMVPQPDQLPEDWRHQLPKGPNLVAILNSLEEVPLEQYGLPEMPAE